MECENDIEEGTQEDIQEGIDISHYQGDINWSKLTPEKSGKKFIIMKATGGADFKDPKFRENFKNARANGFKVGAYHFLTFDATVKPRVLAKSQVYNFLKQVEGVSGWEKGIVAIDVEEGKSTEADLKFMGPVVKQYGKILKGKKPDLRLVIYTRQNLWDKYVSKTPEKILRLFPQLWIARWRNKAPSPAELPNGWKEWAAWQYSSTGEVPGIQGNVDLDQMKSKFL